MYLRQILPRPKCTKICILLIDLDLNGLGPIDYITEVDVTKANSLSNHILGANCNCKTLRIR